MLISLKELNKFIPSVDLSKTIENDINSLGYEVEEMRKFSNVEGLKFVYIKNVYPNPNATKLNVLELELANGENIIIQTTATNAQKDCITVAFVEGSRSGNIVYKAKEMQGIISQGMCASWSELGYDVSKLPFDPDHLIMLKPSQVNLNDDVAEYFGLKDTIIDITTPSNRPDSNSYYVLASEIAALHRAKFEWFKWDLPAKNEPKLKSKIHIDKNEANALSFFEVHSENNETKLDEMLFLAKHNVDAKGIWAIDVTNLALLYTGVPAHAYDRDEIGNKICCQSYTGKVKILGDKEVDVENVLAIKDENKIISLACVMGLSDTGVTAQTDKIAFEIGVFDAKRVRHGAREIKIESSSSIQGGKGINIEMLRMGMKFLLYKAYTEKKLYSQFVHLPVPKKAQWVVQNRKKLAQYANVNVGELKMFNNVEKKLEQIGFKIEKNRIVAPPYRRDIENFEDMIEEYFRLYGYANFVPKMPVLQPFKTNRRNIGKNIIQSMGYNEIRTYTLVSQQNNYLNPFGFKTDVKLETFVSKEREVIRNSIVISMLEAAEYNIKRRMTNLNFFEFGMINNNKQVVGLLSNQKDFFELKQDIINYLGYKNLEFIPFNNDNNINPNVSAKIMLDGEMIGWIGKVHPSKNNLNIFVAEFYDLEIKKYKLFEAYNNEPLKVIDITVPLTKKENIGSFINKINNEFTVYNIKQVTDYFDEKTQTNKITLRISADNEVIEKINAKYN
ncbi:phenylalanine--tRNA ligase subunit beta [Mycoplasmopsis opalescens]|uniref:phenylalanine--tRNA ligase subunit beta n=1 Tax=Mycoplasmopsis opalescens TaxID=114886 RepID=UPI0004A703D5|nr:phenylalanine--tRNA ligase subunit beta [Mycoplasmopsis opalescens]